MSDLRPCPWCDVIPDTDDGESGGTVECCNRQCPVQPSIFRDHEPSHNGLSLATDEWNTRSADAQAEKLAGLLARAEMAITASAPPPIIVGAWKMPGCDVYFNCTKRPSWLHRTMMRMLLGWTWKDNK